jgi:hypothetical protein
VAACEVCGTQAPPGATFCAVCGHRLGEGPPPPVIVQVQQEPAQTSVVGSALDGCVNCFSCLVVAVLLLALVGWIISC